MDEVAVTRSDGSEDRPGPRDPDGEPGHRAELDPDEVRHAASAALHRMRDLQDALTAVRGEARSAAGDVAVVTEGSGAIVDLRLEPAALSRPADELGRVIVETADAAAREAYLRHAEVLREYSSD